MGFKNFKYEHILCPTHQEEMFENIRVNNPELYSKIISAAEQKHTATDRAVVVTLYYQIPGQCPKTCTSKEFPRITNLEIRTEVAPTFHYKMEWITENISVIGKWN